MAVVILCRKCGKKIKSETDPCPHCGSTERKYAIDYRVDGRGSRRLLRTLPENITSLEQARDIDARRKNLKKAKVKPASPSGLTVDLLFEDYLKWCKKYRSATTCQDIKRTYDAHLKRIMGEEIVHLITEDNYNYYQDTRLAENKRHGNVPPANRTINKELHYFSGFMKWCKRYKKIKVEHFYYEELPEHKRAPVVLTIEEIIKIIKAAKDNPFYYALILSLYTTGIRYSGVVHLKLSSFDFINKSVRAIQKGDKEIILPVDDILIDAVLALGETDPDIYLFRDKRKKITPDNPSGKPIKNIRLTLAKICEAAEVTKKVTPHSFRHAWATHMMGAGVNLRIIQQFLDHEEITTTEQYTHVMIDNLRFASEAVIGKLRSKLGIKAVAPPILQ